MIHQGRWSLERIIRFAERLELMGFPDHDRFLGALEAMTPEQRQRWENDYVDFWNSLCAMTTRSEAA